MQYIHRVLQLEQSSWLEKYIILETELRAKAINSFQKVLYNSINNDKYGKTIENQRKHKNIHLVTKWSGRYGVKTYSSRPNFENYHFQRKICSSGNFLNWCEDTNAYDDDMIKPKFRDKAKQLDTDSIVYVISDNDVYKFMKENL